MPVNPRQPALGPANVGRRGEADLVRSTRSGGGVEDTDLERRVLAHERILQALIAHMAKAEPQFVARLSTIFRDPLTTDRREHDFTYTHAYADQFVGKVVQLVEPAGEHAAAGQPAPQPRGVPRSIDAAATSGGRAVTQLEVKRRVGIWEVTRDGRFYGHYQEDQPAFDAAEAVALDVVASGGAADLWWNDSRRQSEDSDPTGVASRGVSRVIEFRSGSTRIVR